MNDLAKVEHHEAPAVTSESAALISMIERAARDPAVDVEKFERLMAMRERVDERNAERAFNTAVSAAKGDIGTIAKNRTVDFTSQKGRTNYRHEDFAGIARTIDPVLMRHGLSYRFRSTQDGQKLTVTCILSHADGHAEQTTLSASEDHSGNKNSIQAIGSAATYLQRYTLKLALGLASSDDDDGRATSGVSHEPISEAQQAELTKLIHETKTDINAFLRFGGVESLADIAVANFPAAKARLQSKKAQMMKAGQS